MYKSTPYNFLLLTAESCFDIDPGKKIMYIIDGSVAICKRIFSIPVKDNENNSGISKNAD